MARLLALAAALSLLLAASASAQWGTGAYHYSDGGTFTVAEGSDPDSTITPNAYGNDFVASKLSLACVGDTLFFSYVQSNGVGVDSLEIWPLGTTGGMVYNFDVDIAEWTIHRPYADSDSLACRCTWLGRK